MAESTLPIFQDCVGSWSLETFYLDLSCAKFAQCKVSKPVLKCNWRVNQSELHVHLKSSHQIDVLLKRKNSETRQEDSREKIPKITTIEKFVDDTTLPAVLARMTAYDGLPFKVFITSIDLRKSLIAQGYSLRKHSWKV